MKFNEYYKYYLTLHQNKWTKRLHVVGQLVTVFFVVMCISVSAWWTLLLAPFIIYPFAWAGHAFFEKNKPAAWSHPLWAKASDWIMLKDILLGRVKC